MKKSNKLFSLVKAVIFLVPLLGITFALTACDPRTPKEKASDGVSKIGQGKVSEGMEDMGEAAEDAAKKD